MKLYRFLFDFWLNFWLKFYKEFYRLIFCCLNFSVKKIFFLQNALLLYLSLKHGYRSTGLHTPCNNVHMTGSSSLLQIHPENDYDQRGSNTIGPRIFIRNAPPITGSLSQQ